jgi:hypothetical protein
MPMAESSAAYLAKAARSAASRSQGGGPVESAVRPDTFGVPEGPQQAGQFGPLPSVLRPSLQGESKDRADRRGGGSRTIIFWWLIAVFVAAGVAWALTTALAQQKPADPAKAAPAKGAPAPAKQQPQPQPQQQQAQPQQQGALPVSTEQALYLIRSILLTLNDANRSGNYTVLRDLAAPDFQARNTAADLSQSFSDLRRRNFDLYGAALLPPQLTSLPALDQRGFLHLAGYFPTRPQQINFDLLFANVANQWRLFGISIATPEAPTAGR